jgi:hypothetical protein
MKTIAAVVSFALLASSAQAQSPTDKSDLNVQCRKQATERFARTGASMTKRNFANHYNLRLKKCFYLESAAFYEGAQKVLDLVDLRENKVIGTYDKFEGAPVVVCLVQDRQCKSEEEWRALVQPFMEDLTCH